MNRKIWFSAVVVGLIAFMTSLLWYSPILFGEVWSQYTGNTIDSSELWKFVFAPLREIITSCVIALLLLRMAPLTNIEPIALAGILWIGFYGVQLTGAVIWDGMPSALGLIHAGDWLIKLLVITWLMKLAISRYSAKSAVLP